MGDGWSWGAHLYEEDDVEATDMFEQHKKVNRSMEEQLTPEHEDHLVAETIGGTSRSAKPYRPGMYDKHPPVPDMNGYCAQTVTDENGNEKRCDLWQENEIHQSIDHAQLKSRSANVKHVLDKQQVAGFDGRVGMYPPHPYQGMKGLIGGSCQVCGGPATNPVHNAATTAVPKSQVLNAIQQPAVYMEATGPRSANYEFLNIPTEQANYIVREILPDMLNRFLAKNKDYGEPDAAMDLGPKAEFVRLWNKVLKLRRALWEGEELEFEQADEIIDDLLGHLLLARFGLSR